MTSPLDGRISLFRERLTADPASLVYVPLADILQEQGRFDEALAVLEEGVARHPGHLPGQVVLGRTLLAAGRDELGVRVLEQVLEEAPDNLVVLRRLAEHHVEVGQGAQARPHLDRLVELEPHERKWTSALEDLAPLPVEPTPEPMVHKTPDVAPAGPVQGRGDGLVTLTLVDIMIQQGYVEKAMAALRLMEERDPGRPEVRERIDGLLDQKPRQVGAIRAEQVSRPVKPEERARHKEQFGQWLDQLRSDSGEAS